MWLTSRPTLVAGSAPTCAVLIEPGVRFVVEMPMTTVGLGPLEFCANTTANVLSDSDGFKVFGVNAVADAAKVIPNQTDWWFTSKEVMSGHTLASGETPIALKEFSQPEDASISTTRISQSPETFLGSGSPRAYVFGNQRIAVQLPASPVQMAPAVAMNGGRAEGDATLVWHREPTFPVTRGRTVTRRGSTPFYPIRPVSVAA